MCVSCFYFFFIFFVIFFLFFTILFYVFFFFFFFQAEDGIRDRTVTGVQTCALPIFIEILLLSAAVRCRRCLRIRARQLDFFDSGRAPSSRSRLLDNAQAGSRSGSWVKTTIGAVVGKRARQAAAGLTLAEHPHAAMSSPSIPSIAIGFSS